MNRKNRLFSQVGLLMILVGALLLGKPGPGHAQPAISQWNQIYRMALDYERLGYYSKAVEQYKILFQVQPRNTTYYRGLTRNLERTGRFEEVVQVIQQRLAVADDALTRSDLGRALYKMGKEKRAELEWQRVLQKYSRNGGAYTQVASAMLANHLIDEAVEVYKKGRKALQNNHLFAIEIANIYSEQRKFDRATAEFLNYLEISPRQLPYIQRRILSFFDEDGSEKVLQVIENYLRKKPRPMKEILELYANCLKRVDRYKDALQIYVRLEEEKTLNKYNRGQGGNLYNFANEAVRAGKIDQAIAAYQLLAQRWPKSPYILSAQMGLAEAYLKSNRQDLALSILDDVIQSKGPKLFKLRAQLMKGNILLNNLEEPDQAITVFKQIYNQFSEREARKNSALALGDCYTQIGDIQSASQWYGAALQLLPARQISQRNTIYYKLAELAFFNQQFRKSISLLEKVEPGSNALSTGEDLVNDALDLTFFIEQSMPDSNGALKYYAEYRKMLAQKKRPEALQNLEKIINQFPASLVAPRALLDAAPLFYKLKMPEKEIEAYQKILQNYGKSIYVDAALFQLALAYERDGKSTEAITAYEKLLVDFPQSIYLEEARQKLRALRDKSKQS